MVHLVCRGLLSYFQPFYLVTQLNIARSFYAAKFQLMNNLSIKHQNQVQSVLKIIIVCLIIFPNKNKLTLFQRLTQIMPKTYKVEKIIAKQIDPKGTLHYLIKWEGWSYQDSTWQPINHLNNCLQSVLEFQRKGINSDDFQLIKSIAPPWVRPQVQIKKQSLEVKKTKPIKKENKKKHQKESKKKQEKIVQLFTTNSDNKRSELRLQELVQQQENLQKSDHYNSQYSPLLQIVGMKRKVDDSQFQFVVKYKNDDRRNYQLGHWTLFMEYPRQLCLFYEKNIQISHNEEPK